MLSTNQSIINSEDMNNRMKLILTFLSFFTITEAQFPVCDPVNVEFFPHPHDCESFIICALGEQHILSCATNLHFSPTELRCMAPDLARCHVNYLCPPNDINLTFLPNSYDCAVYYLCHLGRPIQRECAPGLWFDVRYGWCTHWDKVVCDNRTVVNPDNPGDRTTTTILPPIGPGPNLTVCWKQADLFNNGRYLKSLCIVDKMLNYDPAEQMCRNNGMELFTIDDPYTQFQFQNSLSELMGNDPRSFLWINGRVDDDCNNWYSFNPERKLLPNFIHWVQILSFVGRHTGPCLMYTRHFSANRQFYGFGVECHGAAWLVCEFSNGFVKGSDEL
ncbi:hypothetical protein ACKWTF_003239 [Chironomus riparius]